MRERKSIMEDKAQAFIVVPGGIGTYEELYEVLTLRQLGCMDKTIVLLNFNGFYDEMLAALDGAISKGFVTPQCRSLFTCVNDWRQAVLLAEKASSVPEVEQLKRG